MVKGGGIISRKKVLKGRETSKAFKILYEAWSRKKEGEEVFKKNAVGQWDKFRKNKEKRNLNVQLHKSGFGPHYDSAVGEK